VAQDAALQDAARWRAVDSTAVAPAADANTASGHLTIGSSGDRNSEA
jgi:hypothetical protein